MLETLPRRSERQLRTRRRGVAVLLALVLVVVLLMVGGGLYWQWATGASGPNAHVTVVIPPGASGAHVAELLKEKGVIRSTLAFKLLARFRGFGHGFQAGEYTNLTTNMKISDVLAKLKQGPVAAPSTSVLFPEGFRVTQFGARVQQKLGIEARVFDRAAASGRFSLPPYLPAHTPTVEGFLFPDTYQFLKDISVDGLINRLLAQFKTEANGLDWTNLRRLGVSSPYQVVIVASLIEREARFEQDRPRIAAVIYNRLRKGMRLEVDATIQYAKGNWAPITNQDKSLSSPYNTYLHSGLPPTPIASPGLASLKAALAPARADYLYYVVTDCQGHSGFASTYQQFLHLLASRPSC
jgi:UPF0755 protein